MKNNPLRALAIRPNKLMQVQVIPVNERIAQIDMIPEFGDPASLVINRDIAMFLIGQLQEFLKPVSSGETN